MQFFKLFVFICLTLCIFITNIAYSFEAPSGLMCELLANPQNTTIGDANPEFSWIMNSGLDDDSQTAYQIMVASSESLLEQNNPNFWNSNKMSSSQSINIVYGGAALTINQQYYWKVRVWNKNDQVSDWSVYQQFKTGSTLAGYSTARYKQIETSVAPASVTQIDNGRFLIDFGKDAFGYVRWKIPDQVIRFGTEDETMLKLQSTQLDDLSDGSVEFHFGEKLENGLIDRTPGGTIRYYKNTLTLNGSSEYEIHPPGTTTGIKIPSEFGRIAPFRYLELVNCPINVSISDINQITIHYPFDDDASSFHSDNQTLNDVWELCKYSIKPTSFCAVYVDGDRERKPYEADAYINQLSHYCVDREFSLARYSHEYLLSHSTWPTEWKQHSIMMAWADYLYTGNTESLVQNYDVLKNTKLLQQYARTDGLLDTSGLQDIVDWPAGERDGYAFKSVNTVVNSFYYYTLLQMEKIATILGYTADADKFSQNAQQVYQSFQNVLYNTQTGIYVDGEGTTHSSLHANMFPLAFGLVPDDKIDTVSDFVISKGMACSVYGAQYLLEALYISGNEQAALDLIISESSRSWVNMIREGSTITMEAWGIAYKPNQDWNHAWGAAPANIIPRFIAGIRPLEPGFAKALIQPQPAALNQFSASIPTIRGNVSIAMNKEANQCSFELQIPANMTARFIIPDNCSTFATVLLDNTEITPQHDGTMKYLDPIPSGSHKIICK